MEQNTASKDIENTEAESAEPTARMRMIVPNGFDQNRMSVYARSIAPIVFEKLRDPVFLAEAKERSKLYDMPLDPSKAPMKDRKAINMLKSLVDYSDALAKAIKEYLENKNPGAQIDEELCKRLLTHYAFEGLLKLSGLEDET